MTKVPIRTVYVEDSPEHRDMLEHILQDNKRFHHLMSFDNARDCLEYLKTHSVDLAFIDIELNDENGLWLANQIRTLPVAIVFLTSHIGYAVQAFEACALDYIIKPVSKDDIARMLERLEIRLNRQHHLMQRMQVMELYEHYMPRQAVPSRIFINFIGETHIAELADVMYLKSIQRYTHIQMADGTKHVSSKNLKVYVDTIEAHPDFIRTHRSVLVNKRYVRALHSDSQSKKHSLQMANGDLVEISRLKKDEIIRAVFS